MAYEVIIKKQAKKMLQTLARSHRFRIVEKIMRLSKDPGDTNLDVKPLQGEPFYRLRVGQWRIIFDRRDKVKIISIEKIKSRGDAYK